MKKTKETTKTTETKTSRDNTAYIAAHVPESLKQDFRRKLIDDHTTAQEVLPQLVSMYISGEIKLKLSSGD